MCDITTFVGGLLEEKGKMNRHSTRNIGKKVCYKTITKKNYQEVDVKEAKNISESNSYDSEDSPKLRKRLKTSYIDEENYVAANEGDDSEEEPFKTKNKYFRVDDPDDEDYDPHKSSHSSKDEDYDSYKSIHSRGAGSNTQTKKNLTEYEIMVQKNREEKMAFLKSLKFDEVKESLSDAVKSLKEKHKPVKRLWKPKSPPGPRRKSLRIAKVEVDLSEEAIATRIEAENVEAIKKKLPEILPFEKALQENYSYEDFNKEFSDLELAAQQPFNEHVPHFDTMQLSNSQIRKVVGTRITSLTFHPMKDNILLAASSKYGQVGFWKVNSGQDSFVFVPHTAGITHLKFNPERPQFIVSSSYDGTLRCGDLEKAVFNEAYNVSEETSCTYFDFLSHSTFLVAQSNGIVSVVDHREKLSRAACKKHQCHDYLVKTVSVHPLDKSYFLTAGQRGKIKLWDLRKLQNQPIVEVQHHKRCVQSAFFSPLTGKHVLTTSSDDSICLFDSSNLGKSLLLQHSMKHNNQTGRWLTTFRSTWLPNTDDAFVVGSMLYPRRIEVYNDKMDNIFNFAHENLGCITSVNIFHPSLSVLAGANSSGKVYVFSNEDVS